jgi:hypothetical protein
LVQSSSSSLNRPPIPLLYGVAEIDSPGLAHRKTLSIMHGCSEAYQPPISYPALVVDWCVARGVKTSMAMQLRASATGPLLDCWRHMPIEKDRQRAPEIIRMHAESMRRTSDPRAELTVIVYHRSCTLYVLVRMHAYRPQYAPSRGRAHGDGRPAPLPCPDDAERTAGGRRAVGTSVSLRPRRRSRARGAGRRTRGGMQLVACACTDEGIRGDSRRLSRPWAADSVLN